MFVWFTAARCSAAARAALRPDGAAAISMRDLMDAAADEKAKTESEITRMMHAIYT